MLTIKDDHLDKYFSNKFVPLCYVSYFINGNQRKLMTEYICRTFYTFDG